MHAFSLTATHTESKVVHQNYPRGGRMSEKVVCQMCGLERRRLGAHLRAAHQLTVAQYQEQFPSALVDVPGSRTRSEECRAKQAAAARNRWSDPLARLEQSDRLKEVAPWKGKTLTEEHKAAISAGGQGVSHVLTDARRSEIGEQGRRVLIEIRTDPGVRAKMATATRRRFAAGGTFGFRSPGVHGRVMQSKVLNGTVQSPGAGRGITGFRQGIPHYCRSTLEANFARVLIHEAVPYEYEPKVFMLPDGARWTPDFHLLAPLGNLVPPGWVELKGWRQADGTLPGTAEDKIMAFEKLTGLKVFVVVQNSDLWREIEARYSGLVPWERPGQNLKTHPAVFGRTH